MRASLGVLLLAVAAMALPGCFPGPNNFRFTSADLQGGWRGFNDALEALTAGDAAEDDQDTTREVVEPDVIRQDGSLLYVLNQYRGLSIVDLDTESVLAQVPTVGYPRDIYLTGNRAYVLVAYAAEFTVSGNTVFYDIGSRLYVVDISDPAAASIVSDFSLEGDLVDSRLVGSVLYAVTAEYQWYYAEGQEVKNQTSASHITSVDLSNEANIHIADSVDTDGMGTVIQATADAIFVASPNWQTGNTAITYVDISDPAGMMAVRGTVAVVGNVADRFKMDVYNGVLRVVSSAWQDQRKVYISTVDLADPDNLSVLAQSEITRARGDSLFATRFDGPRAYVVTYFVVDPLFVIDLSDPVDPQFVGELEVPGWSTHIEPMGDRLIALGVDDTNGRRVSVSLFNVADPANPSLVKRVSFGQDWSWSTAYDDVKALTILDDLIIVPFAGWEEAGGGFDRLQFVSWNTNDLTLRGAVDLQGSVLRSFEGNGPFFGVTTEQVAVIDGSNLDAPSVTNQIPLAENVVDFLPLSASLGVEVISHYDSGVTTVRAAGLPLKLVAGSVDLTIGQFVDAHPRGNSVVLVGTSWTDEYGYTVATVDFSNPASPQITGQTAVNVSPYYGYWWIYPYELDSNQGDVAVSVGADALYAPWMPSYQQDATMLVGDTLVLRCSAPSYGSVIGSGTPYQGIALIDVNALSLKGTVGFGFDSVSLVQQGSNNVFISSKTYVSNGLPWLDAQPLCAYFVTAFDPASATAGPTVNVPGTFVQYDAGSQVLTLRDDEWTQGNAYRSMLRTVRWDGGDAVTTLSSAQLPDGSTLAVIDGSRVFVQSYTDGTWLRSAVVGSDGSIALGAGTRVTDQWASLVDVHGVSAYVTIGGAAVARYDCSGQPVLKELTPVMGTPTRIRFGTQAAYAPLGYFGLVELDL